MPDQNPKRLPPALMCVCVCGGGGGDLRKAILSVVVYHAAVLATEEDFFGF